MKRIAFVKVFLLYLIYQIQAQKTNFVIFIADDVSWNDLGCYGNRDVKTPQIDALAEQGLKFNNAYLTASSCSPSRNSILTGRYPHNTGAAELHTKPPIHLMSLPEMLKNNGYHTVHSGKYHQGDYSKKAFSEIHKEYKAITNSGEGMWLENVKNRPKNKPFFMWFAALDAHRGWGKNKFSGTHKPEDIKPPFYLARGEETKKDMAQYYDEIYRFDYHIGLVKDELEKQGVLKNTLILVMADNGRPFPHSKTRVNDRGMKTPFIIYWPEKITRKAETDALVSVIDIAPTFLDVAGIDPPKSFQGKSFAKLFENPYQDFRNYVFAEHNWHDYEAHERMVRNKDYMYILNSRPDKPQMGPADAVESPSFQELVEIKEKGKLTEIQTDVFITPRPNEELYYYPDDPLQLLNVASIPEQQDELEKLRNILQKWMEETDDNIPENLTKDWFEHVPGYVKTEHHKQRGEMPGEKLDAVHNNNKGPF
jgi:N-sulfoglucosamine sulfohydrolase